MSFSSHSGFHPSLPAPAGGYDTMNMGPQAQQMLPGMPPSAAYPSSVPALQGKMASGSNVTWMQPPPPAPVHQPHQVFRQDYPPHAQARPGHQQAVVQYFHQPMQPGYPTSTPPMASRSMSQPPQQQQYYTPPQVLPSPQQPEIEWLSNDLACCEGVYYQVTQGSQGPIFTAIPIDLEPANPPRPVRYTPPMVPAPHPTTAQQAGYAPTGPDCLHHQRLPQPSVRPQPPRPIPVKRERPPEPQPSQPLLVQPPIIIPGAVKTEPSAGPGPATKCSRTEELPLPVDPRVARFSIKEKLQLLKEMFIPSTGSYTKLDDALKKLQKRREEEEEAETASKKGQTSDEQPTSPDVAITGSEPAPAEAEQPKRPTTGNELYGLLDQTKIKKLPKNIRDQITDNLSRHELYIIPEPPARSKPKAGDGFAKTPAQLRNGEVKKAWRALYREQDRLLSLPEPLPEDGAPQQS